MLKTPDQYGLKSGDVTHLGPVVQSIINPMSSLRGQLVKYFTTL